MAESHLEKCSKSLFMIEMKNITTLNFHFITEKMARINKASDKSYRLGFLGKKN